MATLVGSTRKVGWTQRLLCLALVAVGALLFSSISPAANIPNEKTVLLFSFFRGNGETGLYLARSDDGLAWTELKPPGRSFLDPRLGDKLMRDPCIARGPDGTFHLVWTTGWDEPLMVGIAHSKDLVTWSEQKSIPVMAHEPTAKNVWAPEIFYEEAKQRWLIFWATTIPGRFPETDATGDGGLNHRIYFTATKDFEVYTPTALFYDGGFNVIDATLLPANGRFHLIVKDETRNPVKKHLRIAVGDSPSGPFGPAGPTFTTNWVEGPCAVRLGSDFLVYFDHYTRPQYYGAVKSTDLKVWEDISPQVRMPSGARHGTVLHVPESVVRTVESLQTRTINQP